MSGEFRTIDRDTPMLMPASIQEWLPEQHLARFVVEIVDQLDLSELTSRYGGGGKQAYHPALLVALLFYGYATGVFSSRKLEQATYDSVAFRYITADRHPDHDTIANFRKRFLDELEGLFKQILVLASAMGVMKLGAVSLDGSKIQGNASKHKAMSWGHANDVEKQLEGEVQRLLELAEGADSETPEQQQVELDIPAELQRRQERLAAIQEAKTKIEERAQERHAAERAEYEAKMERREQREAQTGKKPGGRPPQEPQAGPKDKDQVNFTDEQSRIMPASGGAFVQGYNAQAAVEHDSHLVVGNHVSQATNDKQIQTLSCQHAELTLSDVQPTAVIRRIHELQLVEQGARLLWFEGLVQRRPGVRTEVVHHHCDPLRLWIVFFNQPAHPFCPGRRRMVRRYIGAAPIIEWRVVHQQVSHPVALVLRVVAGYLAGTRLLRWPHLLHALLARLIHADHRMRCIVRLGIYLQDVLHPAHEGRVLLWRDAPHLLSPRLDLVFFSTWRTVSWEIEHTIRRRFNSSHSICSVHRARPAGGSLQAMAINCASPSPSSTVARSRLRLRRPKAASSPSSTQRLRILSTFCGVTPT